MHCNGPYFFLSKISLPRFKSVRQAVFFAVGGIGFMYVKRCKYGGTVGTNRGISASKKKKKFGATYVGEAP